MLVAIGLTCAVRPQGLVLLAVYVAALALKLVFDLRAPDGPSGFALRARASFAASSRRRWPSCCSAGGYVALKALQGAGLESGLGAYGGVVKVDYDVSNACELGRGPLRRDRASRSPSSPSAR